MPGYSPKTASVILLLNVLAPSRRSVFLQLVKFCRIRHRCLSQSCARNNDLLMVRQRQYSRCFDRRCDRENGRNIVKCQPKRAAPIKSARWSIYRPNHHRRNIRNFPASNREVIGSPVTHQEPSVSCTGGFLLHKTDAVGLFLKIQWRSNGLGVGREDAGCQERSSLCHLEHASQLTETPARSR